MMRKYGIFLALLLLPLAAAAGTPRVTVGLSIEPGDEASIDFAYLSDNDEFEVDIFGGGGEYTIYLTDEAGNILTSGNFNTDAEVYDDFSGIFSDLFTFPYYEDMKFVKLRKGASELASMDAATVLCNHDGNCDPTENYLSCPVDCPSGTDEDNNYCDRVADGICDPDCYMGGDPDCPEDYTGPPVVKIPVEPEEEPKTHALLYWGVAAVLLIAAAAIHIRAKQPKP